MKVKLLRRVRRRFTIDRIDKLESNASDYMRDMVEYYKTPVYILIDKQEYYPYSLHFFRTLPETKDKLLKLVIKHYGEKFRHTDRVSEKVWWNK